MTFKFVSLSKYENGNTVPFLVLQDQLTTALKLSYPYGIILQSKEKSGNYRGWKENHQNFFSLNNSKEFFYR